MKFDLRKSETLCSTVGSNTNPLELLMLMPCGFHIKTVAYN